MHNVYKISHEGLRFIDKSRGNILIPVVLSIFYIATEFYNLRNVPPVVVAPEAIPLIWFQGLLTFVLLPLSLSIDIMAHFGVIDIHLSSPHFNSHAWQIKFFTSVVYTILTIIAVTRVISYLMV